MKKITRRDFLKVTGVSALTLGLAACGGSSSSTASSTASSVAASTGEPVSGGTLKVALNRTISAQSLDPIYIDSTTADQLCQNYGDPLVLYDADTGTYVPNIATEWDISEDGCTYTFTVPEADLAGKTSRTLKGTATNEYGVTYTAEKTVEIIDIPHGARYKKN